MIALKLEELEELREFYINKALRLEQIFRGGYADTNDVAEYETIAIRLQALQMRIEDLQSKQK